MAHRLQVVLHRSAPCVPGWTAACDRLTPRGRAAAWGRKCAARACLSQCVREHREGAQASWAQSGISDPSAPHNPSNTWNNDKTERHGWGHYACLGVGESWVSLCARWSCCSIWVSVRVCVLCLCLYVCVCVFYVCVYTCMCVCVCVHICVCVRARTHIWVVVCDPPRTHNSWLWRFQPAWTENL